MNSGKKIGWIAGIIVFIALLALVSPKIYQAIQVARAPAISGAWQGTIHVQQASLRGVLKITKNQGQYHATLDSLDQKLMDIPVTKIEYHYPVVRVELSSIAAIYEARLDSTGKEMDGDWKQGTLNIPLTLNWTATPDKIAEPMAESDYQRGDGPQGVWQGTLQVGPTALRLKFRLGTNTDGAWRAEMDSLDQGVNAMAATSADFETPAVKLKFNQIGGAFEGDLNGDKSQLAGTWTQGGQEFPLTLERAKSGEAPAVETEADYAFSSPGELQGHWRGTLSISTVKLRIVFNIARKAEGNFSATLDSPDQGGGHIPATTVTFDGGKAHLEWKGIGAIYDGELKDGKLDGQFSQGGAGMTLHLERDPVR